MTTHVRIENHCLLVNGFSIGNFQQLESLSDEVERVMPEDYDMIRALLQLSQSYDAFDYDLFLDSDIRRQRAVQHLLQASRSIS